MKKILPILALALCVFSFTPKTFAQVGEVSDTPELSEIFADPVLRESLLSLTVHKDDIPNLLLNNVFDVATNVAYQLSFDMIGEFSVVEKQQRQVRVVGGFILTTSAELGKKTVYYNFSVSNLLWVTWCLDGDSRCVRISDSNGNCYQKISENEWDVFSKPIPPSTLQSGLDKFLEY